MVYKNGITFGDYNEEPNETKKLKPLIDTSFFTGGASKIYTDIDPTEDQTPKRRGRPKKEIINPNDIVHENNGRELTMMESNKPYYETYQETTNMLRGSVGQIDQVQGELMSDLESIRASKTLKKKYDYISMLGSTISTLIGTKVTAVREINKTITDSHNLDMKRQKELKITETAKDDNKSIMDMYKAFVNTPVGSYGGQGMSLPTISDITMATPGMDRIGMVEDQTLYQQQLSTITPEMNMMILDANQSAETVVYMDDSTGATWFEVVDKFSGQPIPNTVKPDPMFINNLTYDRYNKIARDTNLNKQYKLIILNENTNLSAY